MHSHLNLSNIKLMSICLLIFFFILNYFLSFKTYELLNGLSILGLQVCLILLLSFGIFSFLRALKKHNFYSNLFILTQLLFWLFWAVLNHPGYFNIDTVFLHSNVAKGELFPWQGNIYPLLVQCMYYLDKTFFTMALLHIYILIACFKICLDVVSIKNLSTVFFVSFFCLTPIWVFNVIHINRDILFGLLNVFFSLYLARLIFLKKKLSLKEMGSILLLCFVLSEMRQDAKPYLFAVIFLLWPYRDLFQVSKKYLLSAWAGLIIFTFAINVLWYQKKMNLLDQRYQLSAVYHTLNYFVYNYPDVLSDVEKEKISKVVDYSFMRKNYSANWIGGFHDQKYTIPEDAKIWSDFLQTYVGIIFKNPYIFLMERMGLFLNANNLTHGTWFHANAFDAHMNTLKIERLRVSDEMRAFLNNSLYSFAKKLDEYFITRIVFVSPIFLLIFSMLVVFKNQLLRRYYYLFLLFLSSRLVITFFLAPEPQMKYYSPLMFLPIFIILLAVGKREVVKISD